MPTRIWPSLIAARLYARRMDIRNILILTGAGVSAESGLDTFRGAGGIRPHVVWFGEIPYEMDRIDDALQRCDLFVAIGTSGEVYPAAGFVQTARYRGARTIEINLEPSQGSLFFDESRIGKAGELV